MAQAFRILLITVVILHVCTANNINPGLQIQISTTGIQYAAQQALNVLSSKIRGKRLPDQSGSAELPVIGKINYKVNEMVINSFSTPLTSVTTAPKFRWEIRNIGANVHGDWQYKHTHIIHISDHGHFDISLSDWGMDATLLVGMDANGRPTLKSTGCIVSVGDIHVKISNKLYDLFKHTITHAVTKQLEEMFCEAVNNAINVNGAKQLATLKVQVPVGKSKKVELDYRLVRPPAFTKTAMQSFHKGEMFWIGDRQDAPFSAPPLPNLQTNRMVTILLSQYMMNTLGYVDYKHNAIKHLLSKKDLPPDMKEYLNTTCSGVNVCIGKVVPQLSKKFPHANVIVNMSVSEPPKLALSTSTGLSGTFKGIMAYSVVQPNTSKPITFAFSTSLSVTFNLTVAIVDTNVTANITHFLVGPQKVVKSDIGPVSALILDLAAIGVVEKYVKPMLQELGQAGFPLPSISNVKYVAPHIAIVKNAVLVMTDVKYVAA